MIVESTPWAEAGLVWDLFSANHSHPVTAIAADCPTPLMRTDPKVLRECERERQRDPENYEREFLGRFMSTDSGAYFDAGAVERSLDTDLAFPLPLDPTARYSAGCDLAFRADASALVINSVRGDTHTIAELVEVRPEKGKPLVPSDVVSLFCNTLDRYGITTVIADSWHFDSVQEHFSKRNIALVRAPEG